MLRVTRPKVPATYRDEFVSAKISFFAEKVTGDFHPALNRNVIGNKRKGFGQTAPLAFEMATTASTARLETRKW